MRKYKFALAMMWGLVAVGLAADSNALAGGWKGTWAGGGGGGGFDMSFAVAADGKLSGSVAVTTDMGNYKATFSTATFAAGKLAAAYDYPPDVQGEVTLAGSFEAGTGTGSGTWSLAAKGQPAQAMAGGTWKVAR